MTEEEKNRLKRKEAPLTFDEWLGFFLMPVNSKSNTFFPADDFNATEENRFEKHGFDRKLRQSYIARLLGFFFYLIVIFIVVAIAKP